MNSDLISKQSDKKIIDIIKKELSESKEVYIASAFISKAVLNQLAKDFENFKNRGGIIKLLTSVMNTFNSPDDFKAVEDRNIDLRIFFPGASTFKTFEDYKKHTPPSFHIKTFLFKKEKAANSLIIGSSNFTMGGLFNNHEWNYFSDYEVNIPTANDITIFDKAINEFNQYWTQNQSIALNPLFFDYYVEKWQKAKEKRDAINQIIETIDKKNTEPRPSQIEALERLKQKRLAGITKTAVIAATGLGKTYLSAFDFKASKMKNILFIAHRENILRKTQETFEIVCGKEFKSVILSGNTRYQEKINAYVNEQSVFAMIQTLSRDVTLKNFGKLDFEYIVCDEFHHSEASTYKKVLNYFEAKFFLGLTATPERMDGKDVLEYCNNDIAYEKRLLEAIDNNWLTPFQYFAIYDKTDYSEIKWQGKGYDESDLEKHLSNDTRVDLIVNNLKRYLPSNGKIKALAFCSNIGHAKYMTKQFNMKGFSSKYVIGETTQEEREKVICELQNENNELNIICSVDVFGEGVDIPEVSHILLLRPTQSFTVFLQQLGRGLRKTQNKDFCVVLDFIGNFKKSYIVPLALKGVTNIVNKREVNSELLLPNNCYIDVDIEVQKIWDDEIRRIIKVRYTKENLVEIYNEFKENIDHSPSLMDFFANIAVCDPTKFIKQFNGWLRTKKEMNDLTKYEKTLLDTKGEKFLLHLEKNLNPNKSYKMVVLNYLLTTKNTQTQWNVENIAMGFRSFYLDNLEYLWDYKAMYNSAKPENYSLKQVKTHICKMPLNYLSNTDDDCFLLDKNTYTFKLKNEFCDYWSQTPFRKLIKDRCEYALKHYFYTKEPEINYDKLKNINYRLNNNQEYNNDLTGIHKNNIVESSTELDNKVLKSIAIPFYSDLKVACGAFREGSAEFASETMHIDNLHNNLDQKRHFIVRASGDSMNGGHNAIKDGDLLLLEINTGGTISNQIFAIKYQSEFGDTSYVLKKIEKLADGSYKLVSMNKKYDDIAVNPKNMFPFARFKYKIGN